MPRPQPPARSWPPALDLGIAMAIALLVVVGTSQIGAEPGERTVDGLAYVCALVAAVSLALWRRWPILVVGVVSLALAVYLARRYPPGPAFLPGPLAVMALGYLQTRRVAWLGVGAALATLMISSAIAESDVAFHGLFFFGWATAGVLTGQALAVRGERAAAERERIAHAHERALASQRLRIAQDLHDSVAHAMSTINVQSGVAAHLIEHKPEQAGIALEAIREASRDALDELGAILGVLRDSDDAAPLTPAGGLHQVEDLVERALNDGLTVTFTQAGEIDSVSPPVGAAAYRAVQEALTNTRRHAGAAAKAAVDVAVAGRGSLTLTVTDDGGQRNGTIHEGRESSGGLGLVGMRERVEATGGSLVVGPASSGGFRVEAAWPERAQQ